MKLIKLNCTACGAPISIPDDLDHLTCSNCGTHLVLERGEGYYSLKAAVQITDAIQQSGRGTQDAIREGANLTQKELKRLQLTQAFGNASSALNATKAEQRALARAHRTPAVTNQLYALNAQEFAQWEEVRHLQGQLDTLDGGDLDRNAPALKTQIDMLERSTQIVRSCPPSPKNQKILQSLAAEKRHYLGNLQTIRTAELREKLKSFTIKKPFSKDLNLLLEQLKQIQADLAALARQPQTPITMQVQKECSQLYNQLYQHWHQQVHRQCWDGLNPNQDPGGDFEKVSAQLNATRTTLKWLAAAPTPSRTISNEIKQLQKQEKRLAKFHGTLLEQVRFKDALKTLRRGLAAFAITQPFSSNLREVRGQMNVFQQDLKSLQARGPAPEVRQAHDELLERYQTLYGHWAKLERERLEGLLKSQDIQPPFSEDPKQAQTDYETVRDDLRKLKGNEKFPGAQELLKEVASKERQLQAHLNALQQAAEKPDTGEAAKKTK